MENQKREKLYKQMLEKPNGLVEINNNNIFIGLRNCVNPGLIKIYDITEFLNLCNTLFLFYVKI